jgi:hypothetical protein
MIIIESVIASFQLNWVTIVNGRTIVEITSPFRYPKICVYVIMRHGRNSGQ